MQEFQPEIKFDANGLVPAIVQDANTNEVLMLAYMNPESLGLTLSTGETHFWSRSRQDADTLLIRVQLAGPACHTGNRTCFYREYRP